MIVNGILCNTIGGTMWSKVNVCIAHNMIIEHRPNHQMISIKKKPV